MPSNGNAATADLLLTFAASLGGRSPRQWLVGSIPRYGDAFGAATAAVPTEAVGWAAHACFQEGPAARPTA